MRDDSFVALLTVAAVGTFALSQPARAQDVARSYAASPDVYTVIAEDEKYRVIAVTWKPGQRDNWHSHGAPVAAYNLTDCNMRLHTPDGKFVDNNSKAGNARVRTQAPSHSLENVGSADCKLVLFEPK